MPDIVSRAIGKKLIFWFSEVGRENIGMIGGKCASLGEIIRAGIPSSDGFTITAQAFNKFVKDVGLSTVISQYIAKFADTTDCTCYEEASHCLRSIIEEKQIPDDLAEVIVEAYDSLSEKCHTTDVPVAVRSSGLAEDMADTSFAGQHDSYGNVWGASELLESVLKCWSSLFTARAISYRIKTKIGFENLGIGIAVQRFILAKCAGVGFTVHPVTGDTSKIIIDGSWGLGESVVSGMVTPDSYVINKQSLTLEEVMIKRKLLEIVPCLKQVGCQQREVSVKRQQKACLNIEQVCKLAELGKKLELHFGCPQDFEWAIDSTVRFPNNIVILQSRPMTAIESAKKPSRQIADMIVSRTLGR